MARESNGLVRRGPSSSQFLNQEVIQYLAFVPIWARRQKSQGAAVTTQEKSTFKPVWTRPQESAFNQRRAHPYARPAYDVSRLRTDQVDHAKAFAKRLSRDRTPGHIDAPLTQLEEMAMAVAEARADGVNPRTASKDEFARREFEAFADLSGFDPNLQTEWTKRFPERESLKLASFLLFRAQRAVPRSKKDTVAKPMSIYQNYLALRRVFRARDVELPDSGSVRETLRGLLKRFIRRFGIDQLRPKRVEPVTPDIIRKVLAFVRKGGSTVKGHLWEMQEWVCFIVTAWMVVNLSAGTRKGESTKLPGDVDHNDWFSRSSVTFEMAGRKYVDPPEAVLRMMKEGDYVYLAPKGSKCDQWGTCHGTEPIVLPFHEDDLNAARWLRDIELRWPAHGQQRTSMALFGDRSGEPFTDSVFAGLVMGTLDQVIGAARAKLLSTHSWRVWLASSLRMCDASDARIQAFGRWLNPDSLKIYARISKQEYAEWVDKLMSVRRIDTARTTSLPVMDAAEAIAAWGDQLKFGKNDMLEPWNDKDTTPLVAAPAPLKPGARVSVYWTELQEWYTGTFTSSRVEAADGGGTQRASRIVYDAVGCWSACTAKQLTYYHCLDDEQWRAEPS
jgi:hypothetical protein